MRTILYIYILSIYYMINIFIVRISYALHHIDNLLGQVNWKIYYLFVYIIYKKKYKQQCISITNRKDSDLVD